MPNVFITNTCNLRCSYCFAKGMLGGASHTEEMTLEEVADVSAFVKRSDAVDALGVPGMLSLLGGEPTRHSRFREIVQSLVADGVVIKMFTNGTFDPETAEFLAGLPAGAISLILNLNRPETYPKGQLERMHDNLRRLHAITALGLTIFRTDFDYDEVIRTIETYDLKRDIRLGIAMPIVGVKNAFVPHADYRAVAERILAFADAASARRIGIGFDCGFILCMFTREELGRLKLLGVRLNFTCDGAIDIGKGGAVWRCFPLYNLHPADYRSFDSIQGIKNHYAGVLPAKVKGITGACGECDHYRQGHCSAGCYAFEYR